MNNRNIAKCLRVYENDSTINVETAVCDVFWIKVPKVRQRFLLCIS